MPLAVAYFTDTVAGDVPESWKVNTAFFTPESPSVTLTGATVRVGAGGSSLRIVPVPVPSPIAIPTGADSATEKVSSASPYRSPLVTTETVLDVWPAVNDRAVSALAV